MGHNLLGLVHYPCSRAVNPSVNTGAILNSRQPVFTGNVYRPSDRCHTGDFIARLSRATLPRALNGACL